MPNGRLLSFKVKFPDEFFNPHAYKLQLPEGKIEGGYSPEPFSSENGSEYNGNYVVSPEEIDELNGKPTGPTAAIIDGQRIKYHGHFVNENGKHLFFTRKGTMQISMGAKKIRHEKVSMRIAREFAERRQHAYMNASVDAGAGDFDAEEMARLETRFDEVKSEGLWIIADDYDPSRKELIIPVAIIESASDSWCYLMSPYYGYLSGRYYINKEADMRLRLVQLYGDQFLAEVDIPETKSNKSKKSKKKPSISEESISFKKDASQRCDKYGSIPQIEAGYSDYFSGINTRTKYDETGETVGKSVKCSEHHPYLIKVPETDEYSGFCCSDKPDDLSTYRANLNFGEEDSGWPSPENLKKYEKTLSNLEEYIQRKQQKKERGSTIRRRKRTKAAKQRRKRSGKRKKKTKD